MTYYKNLKKYPVVSEVSKSLKQQGREKEQMESVQRGNQQQRLEEWVRRVEACRNSGLTVGQWCEENGIAVSTYFSWQRKVFQAAKEVRQAIFAEAPVLENFHPIGHVVASVEVSGVRMQIYGAQTRKDKEIFSKNSLVNFTKIG